RRLGSADDLAAAGPAAEIRQVERCADTVEFLRGGPAEGIGRADIDGMVEEALVLVLVVKLGAAIAEEGAGQADDRQVEREIVAGAPFEDLTAVVAMVDVAVDEGELALQ